jgi:nucleoside-diphosphate-sugar epimerase
MLIHGAAKNLAASTIDSRDRILILGATGWFGETAIRMLANVECQGLLAYSSRGGSVSRKGGAVDVGEWNLKDVAEFSPTIVLNFAFLTREKWSPETDDAYKHANMRLTDQFLASAALPSVHSALTVSSGAVVDAETSVNPYGRLKIEESEQLLLMASAGRSCVVAEAWSLSGCLVKRPDAYLFSDLIVQSLTGSIAIKADHLVYRRYTLVEDYLAVCMHSMRSGWSGRIQSGGELVEAGELANLVAKLAPSSVSVDRSEVIGTDASLYFSDNLEWQMHSEQAGLQPASLAEQVMVVGRALGW